MLKSSSIFISLAVMSISLAAAAQTPSLSMVNPATGPTSGNVTLTLTGSNLNTVTSAKVGATNCPLTLLSSTTVHCTLPQGEGANKPVTVTNPSGTSNAVSFSYAAPTLSQVFPSSGPTTGGSSITLSGSNFGLNPVVSIGSGDCPVTSWSHTSLLCTVPAGAGAGLPVVVNAAGQLSNAATYSYKPPTLTSVTPSGGPTAGGVPITLAGTNFGPSGAVVTVNGKGCPVTSQTHTQLICTLPSGQGVGVPVSVLVSGQTSNSLSYDYAAPSITQVTNQNGSTQGGFQISLLGTNFGTTGGSVTVGGNACPLTSQTDTQVTCTAPSGVGQNLPVIFTVDGRSASSTYSYGGPALTGLSPSVGPAAGGIPLTLSGFNFSTSGATVQIGPSPCPVTSQSQNQVVCTLPSGSGVNVPVTLTVAGTKSNTSPFSYAAPVLSAIFPTTGPTAGGIPLTLSGSNFSTSAQGVFVGSSFCAPTSYSDTQIVCTLPAGTGANKQVLVIVGGQSSNPKPFNYAAPALSQVSPNKGPTAGGVPITLSGSDFGASGAAVTVAGATCPVSSQSNTSIECLLPAGQGATAPVIVDVDGQSSNTLAFQYGAPAIAQLSPSNGPASGGTVITLTGSNFGTSATVTLGGSPCAVQSQSHTQLTCVTPAGSGANRQVIATVGGQSSNAASFSYDAPAISLLQPANGPTSGGFTLTIVGQSFGSTGQASFGSAGCPVVAWSNTQVTCTAPEGLGQSVPVTLTASGQSSNAASFSYDPPQLGSLSPSVGPLAGGVTLTLSGSSFGKQDATVSVGGAACPVTAQTHTSVECTLPAGSGPNKQVTLTTSDGRTSNALVFSYASSPPLATADSLSTDEDAPAKLKLKATDLDGDPLTFAIVTQPPSSEGSVTLAGDEATFTPAPDFNGTTSFTFKANDGALDSPAATIDVTVKPVNDAPVAKAFSAMTDEETSVQVTLAATDVDGDPLTYALVTLPEANQGTVTLAGDVASFTPAAEFRGVATFTFTAMDGTDTSNEATVTVQVAGTNHVPIVQAQTASGDEDTPIVVLLQAADPDGDALTFTIATPVPQGEGTVTVQGPVAIYTPPHDFHGTTSFAFTANDGTLTSQAATVSVEVKAVNDAPVAEGATVVTLQNTPVTFTLHASDVDGDAVTYSVKTPPEFGNATVTIDGDQATFTPKADLVGRSTFVFEASDGTATSTATATVTVEAAPPPTAVSGGGCNCGTGSFALAPWFGLIALVALALRRSSVLR